MCPVSQGSWATDLETAAWRGEWAAHRVSQGRRRAAPLRAPRGSPRPGQDAERSRGFCGHTEHQKLTQDPAASSSLLTDGHCASSLPKVPGPQGQWDREVVSCVAHTSGGIAASQNWGQGWSRGRRSRAFRPGAACGGFELVSSTDWSSRDRPSPRSASTCVLEGQGA